MQAELDRLLERGEASASTSCASRSRRASSTCRPAARPGFGDEDHLWAESLDVNVKKLSDEEREKLVKDVQQLASTRDIDDTEAYYEDARQRLKDVWKLFANKEEPSEDPPAEGEDWPLSRLHREADREGRVPAQADHRRRDVLP